MQSGSVEIVRETGRALQNRRRHLLPPSGVAPLGSSARSPLRPRLLGYAGSNAVPCRSMACLITARDGRPRASPCTLSIVKAHSFFGGPLRSSTCSRIGQAGGNPQRLLVLPNGFRRGCPPSGLWRDDGSNGQFDPHGAAAALLSHRTVPQIGTTRARYDRALKSFNPHLGAELLQPFIELRLRPKTQIGRHVALRAAR